MALDSGGGGGGGSLPPPPTPTAPPPSYTLPPLPYGNPNPNYVPPPNIYQAINSQPPVVNVPNYNELLNQYMGPYRTLEQQQEALLGRQMDLAQQNASKLRGFAESEYGTNSAAASEAHSHLLANIINSLAARGMLRSGARKVRLGVENRRYGRESDLMSLGLQRYLYGLQQSLAQQRLQYEQSLASLQAGLQQQSMSLAPWIQQMYPASTSPPPGSLPSSWQV